MRSRIRSVPIALAALIGLVVTDGASAADAPSKGSLGTKRSVAPDESLAGSLKAPTKKVEDKGPTLQFETFRYQTEVQVSGKRREEMADLKKLIKLEGGGAEMPGWLFRLAELNWEESQYYFFEANRKDDEIIKAGKDPAKVATLRREKKELEDRSGGYQAQAISLYLDIIKRYPQYPRTDEVLFFLGENLWKQAKQQQALEVYKRLITKFPKSRYVPDAWMAFGEFYFGTAEKGNRTENLQRALNAYKKAATYTGSSVYGYAIYKQGWVYYNLGNWSAALDLFKAVILFGDLPTSTLAAEKKIALVREARKDFVLTYSHIGAAETARDEFKRVGGAKGWFDMLKSLADLYYQEGKDREAILTYRQLIDEKPLSPESPLFQSRVVTCAGRMQKKEYAVAQAHAFVKLIKQIIQSGSVKDEAGKKLLQDAQVDAEVTLRTLAVQYHNEFKKMRDDRVAVYAANVYQDYLEVFPDTKHVYDMRFFYAELLFALEKYQRAGDEYTRVAQMDIKILDDQKAAKGSGAKPGKYFQLALENAVFSYDFVDQKAGGIGKRTGDLKQRIAIPPPKQQFLDACQRYVKYLPKGEKVVEVSYKAANIYYQYSHFGEATDLFTRIALDHPKNELAFYSTNLVLDAYNILGDLRNVSGWAKRFYGNAELLRAHPQLREDLINIIETSAFKIIKEHEDKKEYAQAAEAYKTFVRDWPNSKHAPTALFNASVNYGSARDLDSAAEMRDLLMRRYPKDPLAQKAMISAGAEAVAIADFAKAADAYERYFQWWKSTRTTSAPPPPPSGSAKRKGKAPPPPPAPAPAPLTKKATAEDERDNERKAKDALYDAGVFREGLHEYAKAEADRLAYIATWPTSAETPKVFLSLADLYAKQKSYTRELRQLEEYQKRYCGEANEWLAIQHRMARIYTKMGNRGMERKLGDDALKYYRPRRGSVNDRGLPIVAQAMYMEIEPEFEKYDRINFNVAPKLLKAQLEIKGKKLVELQRAYTAVVNLKQAEPAVCALYRIGYAYKRFAQALDDAPMPKEIRSRKDLVDEYKSQLGVIKDPIEKKAVEGLEYAMVKAREYGVSNDCSKKATEILLKYKPDQYGPPAEGVPEVVTPAMADRAEGYSLLAALEPIPPKPAANEPKEPALRVAPLKSGSDKRGGGEPKDAGEDDDLRIEGDPDLPPPDKREDPVPISKPGSKDEDLLP